MIIKVEVAASGNKPGAAIFMSVLFIKNGLVPVGAEKDVRHPVRRSAHLLANHTQVNIRAAFDNQLIMNVTDDKAVPERFHGVAENVAADCLDDVLHELRTVGFDAFPFLCGCDQFSFMEPVRVRTTMWLPVRPNG